MHQITESPFPYKWWLKDGYNFVPKNGLKVFGTFVCAGGSTMGYKLAGYDHIGGVELIPHYARLYRANHNPKYFFEQDIREFVERDDLPDELYSLDILDGSPPCAAFSTSGARERLWGKKSEYEGIKQQKDDLPFVYTRLINKLRPKVCILENVSGLNKGNAKVYLKNIVDDLKDAFDVQVFQLFAASMGVPQIRNRIFVIGRRKDLNLPALELNFNIPQIPFKVTKEFWHIWENEITGQLLNKMWDEIQPGENHKIRFNLAKPHPNKPCFTLLESCSKPGVASVVHPFQKRKLNTKETQICFTFPLDFDFLDENPLSCMGRSVPPVMMANLSHQIYLQCLSKL